MYGAAFLFNFLYASTRFLRFRSRCVAFRLGFSVQSSSNGHTQVTEKLRKNTAKTEDSAAAHTGQGKKEKRCDEKKATKRKKPKKATKKSKKSSIKRGKDTKRETHEKGKQDSQIKKKNSKKKHRRGTHRSREEEKDKNINRETNHHLQNTWAPKKRLPMKKQSTTEPLEKQNTNRKTVFWKNRKKNYHVET